MSVMRSVDRDGRREMRSILFGMYTCTSNNLLLTYTRIPVTGREGVIMNTVKGAVGGALVPSRTPFVCCCLPCIQTAKTSIREVS